jgi:hypothetical protein
MAYPAYIREKARKLRIEKRLSLIEISRRLALPKTTVWYWIQDLPIPELQYRDTPARARSRAKAARSNVARFKALRDAAYREGWDEYELLASVPTFRDFVCMYIGEGYKRCRNTASLANSDPRIISLADQWIRTFSRNKVTYAFQHHADQDPDYLRRFWSFRLGVPLEAITYQRKSNSGQLSGRTWRSKHGVLTVVANDTYLRARLQAWMDRLQDEWLDSLFGPGRGAVWERVRSGSARSWVRIPPPRLSDSS